MVARAEAGWTDVDPEVEPFRGELDFDAPVAHYWPEFGQNNKGGVLVKHVMSHTAGLPGFEPAVTAEQIYDVDGLAAQLGGIQIKITCR